VAVKKDTINREIRVPAVVAIDERRIKQVQSKTQGWIDKLYVNFSGQYVKRGQRLMAIYSPDLVSSQEEYLLALRNLESLQGADPSLLQGAEDLLEAAGRRLKYWDVSDGQIRELENSGKPFKTLTLFSPANGYVIQNGALQGMQITPGNALYTIADLSKVWILASVHEQDLALIAKGMKVVFKADSYPDSEFAGEASYINPQLDPQSRTATVRVELSNPDMVLRPEMYGNAILLKEYSDILVVPASAVMDSGDVKVVYVQTGPGRFVPRQVKVGLRTSEQAQILEGLAEGDMVVVQGNFMLDSESRIRAAPQGTGTSAGGHQH
jgi:Cu(I)/Ag(I) efflux system membrane fusion protein